MSLTSSRLVKAIAIASACTFHGTVLWSYFGKVEIEMAGSAGAMESSIGNSFADMAQGSIAAKEVEEVTEPVTPEAIAEVEPPQMTEAPAPEEVATPVQDPPPEVQATEVPDTALPVLTPVPTDVPQVTLAEKPPLPDPEVTPPTPAEIIEAQDERVVTKSLRPKPRSKEFEKRVTPKKKVAEAKPKKPKAQPRGNAQQNSQTGSDAGKSTQKQRVASVGSAPTQEEGNAAASNYPGKVMKKISRVPKPRVGTKGTSVVAFTISPGGALSAISLARSSGSPKLDQAALRVVRKAAPFPRPPAGARRSFSIKIKGR